MRKLNALTLIELMIGLALMTILMGALVAVFRIAEVSWNIATPSVELQEQVRWAMSGMLNELRQTGATNISVVSGGSSVNFTIPMSISANGTTYSSEINYYQNGTQIFRQNPAGSGTTRVIANNINALDFCCVGGINCTDCVNATRIQVEMNATKVAKSRTFWYNLTEQRRLRNE
ncbi:MAG: prepilin-type N-terminal cleavage/methylation domain-containing protein [Candidatus Omnitrophica bacterium]|nr:prepilin-type N-terminal cleavage/methylation domain-containing protein [Candidatus Omnitrophota bacterium]